jgi:hypothetical protein
VHHHFETAGPSLPCLVGGRSKRDRIIEMTSRRTEGPCLWVFSLVVVTARIYWWLRQRSKSYGRRVGGMSSAAELLVSDLRGKLNGQLSALESARTRAAVGLSVSGVVAGLFGPKLLSSPNNLALAAIALLGLTALLSVYVLIPHDMTLWPEGDGWLGWADEHNANELAGPTLALTMAKDMAVWYKSNESMLERVQWALTLAFVGLTVQLVLWTLSVFKA